MRTWRSFVFLFLCCVVVLSLFLFRLQPTGASAHTQGTTSVDVAPPGKLQLDSRLPVQTVNAKSAPNNVNAKFGSRFDFVVSPSSDLVYSGSDGVYFVIGVGTEPLWQKFTGLIETAIDLRGDDRFRNNAERIKHRSELIPILQKAFHQKPAGEWLQRFAAAHIPAAKINGVSEALNDIQAQARGLVVQLEHPMLGIVKSIANPMRLSDTPVTYRLAPPFLGEHTNQILQSLGYSAEETEARTGLSS